jgi:RpiB/LacA/LacB family sugar-phosphate isomerase
MRPQVEPFDDKLEVAGISNKVPATLFLHSLKVLHSTTVMIAIGSDHGGVELKDFLAGVLRSKSIDVQDFGTRGRQSVDYPDFGRLVSQQVSRGDADRGILICTTGIGMSILANKYPGIRAALVQDLETARTSREHNDANILVLAGAKTAPGLAREILEIWLDTPFAGGRHQRRVDKITEIERALGTFRKS